MSKNIFLNGSPKKRKAVSEKLIGMLKDKLGEAESIQSETIYLYEAEFSEELYDKIYASERIVISMPLYVDCLPAGVLEFFRGCLNYQKENENEKPEFYFMINCGFMEDRQNDTAIKILEKYSGKSGFEYKGGLSIGAGAMILNSNKEYQVWEKMDYLVKMILEGGYLLEEDNFPNSHKQRIDGADESDNGTAIFRVNIDMLRFLFKAKSDKVWVDAAARKGLKKRDLKQKYYK